MYCNLLLLLLLFLPLPGAAKIMSIVGKAYTSPESQPDPAALAAEIVSRAIDNACLLGGDPDATTCVVAYVSEA